MAILSLNTVRASVAGALLLAGAALASAQSVGLPAPRLLTTTPMGGKAGTEFDVTISGEHLEDVVDLVFSDPRIAAKRKLDAAGQPIENQYRVNVAADCPVGLYEARVTTRLGLSSSRVFAVGTLAEVHQTKPNRSLETAQELPMDSVCNGAVADRSIDYFKFSAKRGRRVIVDCATRGIDSKLNATVIVADAAGRDLLVERRGGALDFAVPADGVYVVKVHELTYKGGPAFYYRLGLWEQATGTPIARQPGTLAVNAFSWPPPGLPATATTQEAEPNDAQDKAQRISLPCDIAGRFFPAADVDRFEFTAKKGDEWWIEVASERLGLPTDPAVLVQRVVNGALEDVVELSDIPSPVKVSSNGYAYDGPPYNAGSADVLGKFVVPEDGVYRLQLTDLFGGTRSEPGHVYRLIVRKPQPDFALVGWALHMELRNGDRNALSKPLALRGGATMALEVVAVRRDGFAGAIDLALEGLPAGVTAKGLPIPDSWGEIPSPRLLADVPVSVNGLERAPLTITAKQPVFEAKAGAKLVVPLIHTRTSDFSGDKISMRAVGAPFERAPAFELPVQAAGSEIAFDLAALKVPPGEYTVSVLGGGVVKYRHRPDAIEAAESTSKKMRAEVQSLELEAKKLAGEAGQAPPGKKEQMAKSLEAVNAKMKAATTALGAAQQRLDRAKQEAQPRDIADILVCEPFTIRVLPSETK